MQRLDVLGWIGTAVALGLCATAARMWYLALAELRLTKKQVLEGTMEADDPVGVVARWNFTTASVHLFFAFVLVWILLPLIPPTPSANATTMAVGVPLTWLLGVSCLLVTDLKFRRRLRDSVRQRGDNVIPLRTRNARRAAPRRDTGSGGARDSTSGGRTSSD